MDISTPLSRKEANFVANQYGPRSAEKVHPTWTVNHCDGMSPEALAQSVIPSDLPQFEKIIDALAIGIAVIARRK
jgi:hypothetical protein